MSYTPHSNNNACHAFFYTRDKKSTKTEEIPPTSPSIPENCSRATLTSSESWLLLTEMTLVIRPEVTSFPRDPTDLAEAVEPEVYPESQASPTALASAVEPDTARFPSERVVLSGLLCIDESVVEVKALVDSGATHSFINKELVERYGLRMTTLPAPSIVQDIAGRLLHEITTQVDAALQFGTHSEMIALGVTTVGKSDIVLGKTWLTEHNPDIDWHTNVVTFNIRDCADHLFSSGDAHVEAPELDLYTGEELTAIELELAGTNLSAEIASEHQKKEVPTKELVPKVYHDFLDVFDEYLPEGLPEHGPHDMAIDLVPGAPLPRPLGLYPMSDTEIRELREWLDHLLEIGHIQPSKSPVAAPCFFIPKKDGKNRLGVDWRKLNAVTVKDQYPLPCM